MQQYADIYSLQNYYSSFAVNKYLHTVASVGFFFHIENTFLVFNYVIVILLAEICPGKHCPRCCIGRLYM